MIYIFSAFYAEAKNIIDHYGLKKKKSPEMVRFDVFANESIRLVITGVGEINAAAAVSNIGGGWHAAYANQYAGNTNKVSRRKCL